MIPRRDATSLDSDPARAMRDRELAVPRIPQPDDVSCGPACLHQVLRFFGIEAGFDEVSARVARNPDGGTHAACLGLAALGFGLPATIYSYNLRVFDPTWFELGREELVAKLRAREAVVRRRKLGATVRAYLDFLRAGGEIRFAELSRGLLADILGRGNPVICGLSATYLYLQPRERPDDNEPDDVAGEPVGHFVVVCGHSEDCETFLVNDPWPQAPFAPTGRYSVPAGRLLGAILLGDVTYDAVLVEVGKRLP